MVAEHTIVAMLDDERMVRTVSSGTGDSWVACDFIDFGS